MTQSHPPQPAQEPAPGNGSLGHNLLQKQLQSFGPHSIWIGVLLVLLGSVGIIVPALLSLMTVGLVAGLLVAGAILWGIHTWQHNRGDFMDWLKPLLLAVTGLALMLFPLPGAASLALLLAIYLALDAYSSFAYAHRRHPERGWGWMVANGVADLLLVALFVWDWPQTSLLLLGIYVGVSLIFDGWALIVIGWALRRAGQNDDPQAGHHG